MNDSASTGAKRHPERDTVDGRSLELLVDYSVTLRVPIVSSVLVIAGILLSGGQSRVAVAAWASSALLYREAMAIALPRLLHAAERPLADRLRTTTNWKLGLGITHALAACFITTLDQTYAALLTMILMSLSAGAVSTTFTVPSAFRAYAVPIGAATAIAWFSTGSWLGTGVGVLVLMMLGVQIRFSDRNMSLFRQSFSIRLENLALLDELAIERARLADARDLAVQADVSKSRFLAAASHDLRQPLQSLALNSGALSRMTLDAQTREIASEIGAGIAALSHLLDGLLDISHLDSGDVKPNMQSIPLHRLVSGLCARFRPQAQAKGLRLVHEGDADLMVKSDAEMLQRIVSNLLDNAIKFTSAGTISVHCARHEGFIRLTISDTGCGIALTDRERVFDDLEQLGNPQRNRAYGHGLGLGIVRRTARLLGIRYEILPSPEGGTTIELDLPEGDNRALPFLSDRSGVYPALIARRILVLDDDERVRQAYGHGLRTLGCRVTCAASLAEATASLAANAIDVVLVDYRLAEDCNGFDAIEALRAEVPGLAAIVVSADTSAELRRRAHDLAIPLLQKPVTDATLAATINDAVQVVALDRREPVR